MIAGNGWSGSGVRSGENESGASGCAESGTETAITADGTILTTAVTMIDGVDSILTKGFSDVPRE